MNNTVHLSDLVILAADNDIMFACNALLKRHEMLGIRPLRTKIYVHPYHDPGCRCGSEDFLRQFTREYRHAIVIFDRDGCGRDRKTRDEIENEVTVRLRKSGWEERAAVVVIDPELESWVFSDSAEVDDVLGWMGRTPSLRNWLEGKGYLTPGQIKPSRPKEAMHDALRHIRMPRSSSLYRQLAERVDITGCRDFAFQKLKDTLQSWFSL